MSLSPALQVARELCPYPLTGISDEHLSDILDAWLADEFARESHLHIHSGIQEEAIA